MLLSSSSPPSSSSSSSSSLGSDTVLLSLRIGCDVYHGVHWMVYIGWCTFFLSVLDVMCTCVQWMVFMDGVHWMVFMDGVPGDDGGTDRVHSQSIRQHPINERLHRRRYVWKHDIVNAFIRCIT